MLLPDHTESRRQIVLLIQLKHYGWFDLSEYSTDCPELIEYSQSTRQFFFPRVLREKIEYDRKKLLNLIINENRKKFPGLISPG